MCFILSRAVAELREPAERLSAAAAQPHRGQRNTSIVAGQQFSALQSGLPSGGTTPQYYGAQSVKQVPRWAQVSIQKSIDSQRFNTDKTIQFRDTSEVRGRTSPERPLSPVLQRGLLKNNIAFFENLNK